LRIINADFMKVALQQRKALKAMIKVELESRRTK
jgi:hypothetical protein